MQIVWYAAAVAMVGLALLPARRWSSPLTCALAAAYFAWIGIGYFAWLNPDIGLSGLWAGVGRTPGQIARANWVKAAAIRKAGRTSCASS
jgi:hypothetical protein